VASTDYIDIRSDHLSVYCKFNGRYKVASTDYIDIAYNRPTGDAM
jgi:hypothetical protein